MDFAYHSDVFHSVFMFHTIFFTSVATYEHIPSIYIYIYRYIRIPWLPILQEAPPAPWFAPATPWSAPYNQALGQTSPHTP
jgi:hypothetical protein